MLAQIIFLITFQTTEVMAIEAAIEEHPEGLELELLVAITRHGERASTENFNLTTEGTDFGVGSKKLTETGGKRHHHIGQSLRQEFDKLDHGYINTNEYS